MIFSATDNLNPLCGLLRTRGFALDDKTRKGTARRKGEKI
jgi:hypothetical protein